MHLVIVESPTKARKLAEYLPKDYVIEASVGHVRDLPKNKLGVDLDHDFEPTYVIDPEKQAIIDRLLSLSKKADAVYLATDPDREGEAIAWHIKTILSTDKKNKEAANQIFKRSTFHEITKSAVLSAIENPSTLNQDLVDAQQARRVVDRLVGYQVSPVLWKKIRRGLSAGRVQSVALRLIAEREREIAAFKADEYWEVDVLVATTQAAISANSNVKLETLITDTKAKPPQDFLVARVTSINDKKYEPHVKDDVDPVLTDLNAAQYEVANVERKTRERSSLPPFTTSTLQQSAATRLGYTSKQTMALAQQLYEEGLITYHRTDSVNLSQSSLEMARAYIGKHFGPQYVPASPRFFAQKSKNAQEAHEAVRVTDTNLTGELLQGRYPRITPRHVQLYDLIWRRFLASQMNSAAYDQTAITIKATPTASKPIYTLRTSGSILKFDGWMKLFTSQEDVILPSVTEKQPLFYHDQYAAQKFTQPPARYNDASLVKELEKRGIGRPSTYASIISVIVDRGYVERVDKRFTASQIGLTVSDFLMQHFTTFMDYDFTAEMEENLDRISRGEKPWKKVVKDFYGPLEKTIDAVVEKADRVSIPVEKTGEKCPLCGDTEGGEIVIRTGRFGKFKSCSRFPDCKFTENMVEKMEGMKCPLCQQGDVVIKKSRWGKPFYGCSRYPECDWASWGKPALDLMVTPEEWAVQKQERAEKKAVRDAAREAANPGSTIRGAKSAKKPTKAKTKAKPRKTTKKTPAEKAA